MKKEKKKTKKINKKKIIILVIIVLLLLTLTVFGRYISNSLREMYLTSNEFYFRSDLLELNTPELHFNNWGGVGIYNIDFDLFSLKNELVKTNYDIEYTLNCELKNPEKVKFKINSGMDNKEYNGIIYSKTNKDTISIQIIPLQELKKDEKIEILIKAKSKGPYIQEISARYILEIKEQFLRYTIEDIENQNYATLNLVNRNETDSTATIKFDPNLINVDMNSDAYQNKTNSTTIVIDQKEYINSFSFVMPKETSMKIKFYKKDKNKNYSYPGVNNSSIIEIKGI